MRIHVFILRLSIWLALLSILFVPGTFSTDGASRTAYGFPFKFLTQYHDEADGIRWFLQSVSINLMYYAFNVAIIYFVMLGLRKVLLSVNYTFGKHR